MEAEKYPSQGRAFEERILGVREENVKPKYRLGRYNLNKSLQHVIRENWAAFAEAVEKGFEQFHNPENPQMGETHLLWSAVKRHLPSRVNKQHVPLNLYVTVGKNALDWRHGVDAFFWWQGACVTIDISMLPAEHKNLKADVLFNPEDMEGERLFAFGKRVADLLKERSKAIRPHKRIPKFVELK